MVALLVWALPGSAQDSAPIGILRGSLVGFTGDIRGSLTFRGAGDRLFQCTWDERTYFERDQQRIALRVARAGDPLELLTDHRPGSDLCYARTVNVLDAERPPVPGRPPIRNRRSPTETFSPRGDLTLAGIIARVDAESLTLKIRSGGSRTLLLRSDTRYVGGGQPSEASQLPLNTTVFVRAGRNLEGEMEAYQVVWGEILQVQR